MFRCLIQFINEFQPPTPFIICINFKKHRLFVFLFNVFRERQLLIFIIKFSFIDICRLLQTHRGGLENYTPTPIARVFKNSPGGYFRRYFQFLSPEYSVGYRFLFGAALSPPFYIRSFGAKIFMVCC